MSEFPSYGRRLTGSARRGLTRLGPILRTAIRQALDQRFTSRVFGHRPWLTTRLQILLPSGRTAATVAFEAVQAALFTDSITCRGIDEGEGAVPSRRSAPAWLTAARQVAKDPVENRSLILRVFVPFVFGYYIAYLFRTINAVMAAPLATQLGLGADDLGLLTSWGAPRIHGELLKLGFEVAQSSVAKYMVKRRGPP